MKKKFILGMLASGLLSLTSCIDGGEATGQISGYFTIQNSTNGVVLHMDGGGTIYPTMASVSNITGGKGMGNVKRAWFLLSYPETSMTTDTDNLPIVRDAELVQGQEIQVLNIISPEQAEAKKLLEKDSINDIVALKNIWGYNGYITTIFETKWVSNSKGVKVPTMNFVYEQDSSDPRIVNATFLLNFHKSGNDDIISSQTGTLMGSYDVSVLGSMLPVSGIDSITVNFKGQGIKDGAIKIATKQLYHKF